MNTEPYKKCRAMYISEKSSMFFEKGKIYDAYIPKCSGGDAFLAFWFSEEEMDEEGFYALPANRFIIMDETFSDPDGSIEEIES